MKDYLHERETIRFVFPLDGDCVNEGDGFSHQPSTAGFIGEQAL